LAGAGVGAFAALIAYLQWVTAHQKIVLELFDKRLEAFRGIQASIIEVMRSGAVTRQEFSAFAEAVERCRFLFGDDVHQYLEDLRSKFSFMSIFTDQTIDQRTEPGRSKLIDRKYDSNFETDGVPLFAPYLKLDQKMRYFWPVKEWLPTLKNKIVAKDRNHT
jgi:hypothetical protein